MNKFSILALIMVMMILACFVPVSLGASLLPTAPPVPTFTPLPTVIMPTQRPYPMPTLSLSPAPYMPTPTPLSTGSFYPLADHWVFIPLVTR